MKLYTFILIYLIIIQASSCTTPQSVQLPKKQDEIILEVITTAAGNIYPKEGELLDMRLYESGRFEYDDYPDYNPPHTRTGNISITRKEGGLNPEDVKELVSLASQPDFLSAKEHYPRMQSGVTDIVWNTTVRFTHRGHVKEIYAEYFWTSYNSKEDRSKYPPSMVKLLGRVEELKAKAIGKQSKNLMWSALLNKS